MRTFDTYDTYNRYDTYGTIHTIQALRSMQAIHAIHTMYIYVLLQYIHTRYAYNDTSKETILDTYDPVHDMIHTIQDIRYNTLHTIDT